MWPFFRTMWPFGPYHVSNAHIITGGYSCLTMYVRGVSVLGSMCNCMLVCWVYGTNGVSHFGHGMYVRMWMGVSNQWPITPILLYVYLSKCIGVPRLWSRPCGWVYGSNRVYNCISLVMVMCVGMFGPWHMHGHKCRCVGLWNQWGVSVLTTKVIWTEGPLTIIRNLLCYHNIWSKCYGNIAHLQYLIMKHCTVNQNSKKKKWHPLGL